MPVLPVKIQHHASFDNYFQDNIYNPELIVFHPSELQLPGSVQKGALQVEPVVGEFGNVWYRNYWDGHLLEQVRVVFPGGNEKIFPVNSLVKIYHFPGLFYDLHNYILLLVNDHGDPLLPAPAPQLGGLRRARSATRRWRHRRQHRHRGRSAATRRR